MVSCHNKKSYFIEGDWIYKTMYLNEDNTDSITIDLRVKFLENGDIMENKYHLWHRYKIQGNKFHFIKSDTIALTYEIITASNSKIILDTKIPVKEENKDTTYYQKLLFIRTDPLPDEPFDEILYELAKHYDIGISDTLGDGTIFYNFNAERYTDDFQVIYDNPHKSEHMIKGI